MHIGEKIREARKSQNISMSELARRAGIGQSTLSYIESGQRQPTFDSLESIVKALNLTFSDFMKESEDEQLMPPEIRQIMNKVVKLSPDKLKILNDVLDTWVE